LKLLPCVITIATALRISSHESRPLGGICI